MNISNHFTPETTMIVASFALAWLIVGILAGKMMRGGSVPSSRTPSKPPQGGARRARSNGNGLIEIYVGNLAYEVSEKDLAKAFGEFGEVASARIITHKFSGKSKGFGFIEMGDRGEANAAIRALNGRDLKGRRIVANEAKSKSRD